jgi:3-methyladenine DNA glycosylase AlkD
MTTDQILSRLEAMGSEKVRLQNARSGAGDRQFGVRMGDIRAMAKELGIDPPLAAELWKTGFLEARLLAILMLRPKQLSGQEVEEMVTESTYPWLADWLNSYIVKAHPQKEDLRQKWMSSNDPMLRRSAWSLTAERIDKKPEGLDLSAILDQLEKEMPTAPEAAQWTMNFALGGIGINFPEHRQRAIAIGEKLGLYRDYPVSKGCTSPYVPTWIEEMVRRQNA